MKRLAAVSFSLLALVILTACAGGLPARTSSVQDDIVATEYAKGEVERAIEHFRQAMIQRRPDWIIESSDEELTFGHSNGVVQTREEFAEVVRSGSEIFKRIDLTNRRLVISGDVAIERHHFSADIIYQGKLKNFELEVVEVWQNTDGWHLLARQAVNI